LAQVGRRPRGPDDDEHDLKLIVRVKRGDRGAFDELCQRYTPMILGQAHTLLPAQDADDALVITFRKIWRGASSFDPNRFSRVRPWIASIARNTTIDLHRRLAARRGHELSLERVVEMGNEEVSDPFGRPSFPSPEETVLERQLSPRITALLAELRGTQRDIAYLIAHGLTDEEIAYVLGLSIRAVKERKRRLRRHLRGELEEPSSEDGATDPDDDQGSPSPGEVR
jgi:RNA polymerase sigma-70 factor, ECF subfamily